MEHLFQSTQRQARDAAQAWCASRLDELASWPSDGGSLALAPVMATLIDDWTCGQRQLAFAWCQCHLLALRDDAYQAARDAWRSLWSTFWTELCLRMGLPSFAAVTSHVFEATCQLHLIRWRRSIDRAALEEFCVGWARWLDGRLAPEAPWRRLARETALEASAKVADLLAASNGAAITIAQSAAAIVAEGGVAALTHRAVASRAGVSLGVVSYNFPTSAELVRAAFETIYRAIVERSSIQPEELPGRDEVVGRWRRSAIQSSNYAALEELMLAVARDADLREFGPQMRYLRGRTSGIHLAALLGPEVSISPLDAAIYSSLMSGQQRALIGCADADIAKSLAKTELLVGALKP